MRRDVASPLRHSEDQPGLPQQPQCVQHGVPADPVLMLEVCHRRQWPRMPLVRLDAPAQNRLKLAVRRNGRTGINYVISAHKINLGHAKPALTSAYICTVLL